MGGARMRELGVQSWRLAVVAQVLGVAACVMVLVWCIHFRGGLAFVATNKSLIFNIHPVLMLIGFIFLGSEAILAYRVLPGTKQQLKIVHSALHLIALALGIIGIYAAFKYHNESGIANLYSLHSWFGLGTIALFAIQWILGFVAFWFPGAPEGLRAASLPWHVLFGSIVYVLALTTAVLGFLEKLTFLEAAGLAKYGPEAFLVNFTAIVVLLFGVFVLLSIITSTTPSPVDEFGYRPLAQSQ
ncbi:probable ascorbate-specific transmembrane electron transporter 1 isoform X1 [Nymphaea colorata]|nr:probable ascorbate-specific transmembrane electron transporter 1 isoform X1 [Nymphaea colorata]